MVYLSENSDFAEFFIPFLQQDIDVGLYRQLCELVAQRAAHVADDLGAGLPLGDDALDHAELIQILRGQAQCLCGLFTAEQLEQFDALETYGYDFYFPQNADGTPLDWNDPAAEPVG